MNGEDVFVNNYLKKKIGFYVDVGAYHPLELNNTYLLYKKGWNGINIDINSTHINLGLYLIDHFNPNKKIIKKNKIYKFLVQKKYKLIWSGHFSHIFARK